MNSLRRYIYALFILLVLFNDELFTFYLYVTDTFVEVGMKSVMAVIIGVCTYVLLLYDVLSNKIAKKEWRILSAFLFLLVLYYLTGVVYSSMPKRYYSMLLYYGAITLPAGYLGIRMARKDIHETIDKVLPYVVAAFSIVIGTVGLSAAVENRMVTGDASSLNYQTISYYMAFLYTYCIYYIFFSTQRHTRVYRWMKWIMAFFMFYDAAVCLMSGGRGAFVYLIIVSIYIVYRMFNSKIISPSYVILLLIVVLYAFYRLAAYWNIWESAGFMRMQSMLYQDELRMKLWERAWDAFSESPVLGWGVGSIWYTVKFYSHNVVLDFLAETGIVGLTIFIVIIVSMLKKLGKIVKLAPQNMFFMFTFMGTFVMLMFSGYWVVAYQLFMVAGYVFAYNYDRRDVS